MPARHNGATLVEMDSTLYLKDTAGAAKLYPGYLLLEVRQEVCQQKLFVYGHPAGYGRLVAGAAPIKDTGTATKKPFIAVHGSIMYEGFYQSNLDTPFIQQDIYQHSITAALDVTLKDQYPMRVFFTTRFSNAPFLKNLADINTQFNQPEFKNQLVKKALDWQRAHFPLADSLRRLASLIAAKRAQLTALRDRLNSPAMLQKLVEQRERLWLDSAWKRGYANPGYPTDFDNIAKTKKAIFNTWLFSLARQKGMVERQEGPVSRTLKKDGIADFQGAYNRDKKGLDSLSKMIDSLQARYQACQLGVKNTSDSLDKLVRYIKQPKDAVEAIRSSGLPDSLLPKNYKTLLALKTIGIGRSTVNFSELSVQHISINGLVAEYNPGGYIAVAAGSINYRFRDYIVKDQNSPKQYVTAVRFGLGAKEGNHLFFTYFAGKKQVYNYGSDSVHLPSSTQPNYNLLGWSVEGRFQLTPTAYIVAEAAKSSMPYYGGQPGKRGLLASSFSFKDRTNEAYSLSVVASLPATATRFVGFYKKLGANFQSFSLFTTSSAQTAWGLQVSQPFFTKRLIVEASLKKNDFTNPYINQVFYSNTAFKSIRATLRLKQMPVLSVGYYPSSQLTKLGPGQFIENLFYTLVATGSHFYSFRGIMMSTMVGYTQFYNRAQDSNFVYFNTRNLMLTQTVQLNRCMIQASFSAAKNEGYDLYTLEGGADYKIARWLALGGSLKYNRQTIFNNRQLGYGLNTTVKMGNIGDIQLIAQKTYIPGPGKQLVENDIGRLVYYKTF